MKKKPLSWGLLFFIFAALLSIVGTYFITQNCLDADAASELILSDHLAATGRILSSDWFYSTELRVVNTQLVYTPLFLIFNQWHTVRWVGALILQAILILSYFGFCRLLKLDRSLFFWGGGLLLLPLSVCYGRIILYHCYYIPHLALSLWIIGLTCAASKSRLRATLRIALLCILSFLGGLGGIRQLMMTHAPLLMALALAFMLGGFFRKGAPWQKTLRCFGGAMASTLCSFGGFWLNKTVLTQAYSYADMSDVSISFLSPDRYTDLFYGYFHPFGLRKDTPALSVQGILSVLAIGMGLLCFFLALRGAWRNRKELQKAIPHLIYLSFAIVMLGVFLLLGGSYSFVLYLSPLTLWMVPVLVSPLGELPQGAPLYRRILPALTVGILALNGLVNGAYLLRSDLFPQAYEGLSYHNKDQVAQLQGALHFLRREGYTRAYATPWNANILTELSDGAIRAVPLGMLPNGALTISNWLTLKETRDLQGQKDFLLISVSEEGYFHARYSLSEPIVYRDDFYIIYDLSKEGT